MKRVKRLPEMRAAVRHALGALALAGAAASNAATINSNDAAVYASFATGATLQNFEATTVVPLTISSYSSALNSSTAVPTASQLSLDVADLLFHSGGASFNNPIGNPGTPTVLLKLDGGIAGDAHSATNVVGSLEINTDLLDLDNFVEIVFINALQSRVGVWLNPSLGNVTFTAFDSTGNSLESVSGTAGNFVGIDRAAADIRFVSIVGSASAFTIDDLTYAGARTTTVPAPGAGLLALGLCGLLARRRRAV